jgi:copper transport protein
VLIASGATLTCLQLNRPAALWETSYGRVLLAKLGLVVVLLGLGAINRYRLTRPVLHGDPDARGRLRRVILVEVAVAASILAVVALWRFTPPPRSLAPVPVSATVSAHLHSPAAMAELSFVPARTGGLVSLQLHLFDAGMSPLAAQEVTIAFSNRQAQIEPIRYAAVHEADGTWRVPELRLPALGDWAVEIDALVSDFDRIRLTGELRFPHPLPTSSTESK